MRILTPEVYEAIADTHRRFTSTIPSSTGEVKAPSPVAETLARGGWQVAAPAKGLVRRHVELCLPAGPESAKAAQHSGADVWVGDFEDGMSPTWDNLLAGHAALARYARSYTPDRPTLMVRPRPLGVMEPRIEVDGQPVPASIVDTVVFFHHCARTLVDRGVGPYLYLTKLTNPNQAAWWNRLLTHLEDGYAIPRGSARAGVLVETLPGAFAMEQILFELRHHAAGLTVGRWDYLLSLMTTGAAGQGVSLPERSAITITTPVMKALSTAVVEVAHRRGTHAIGALSGYTTHNVDDPTRVLGRVRAEKAHEARIGFDGSWAACPTVVGAAKAGFADVVGQGSHQLCRANPLSNGRVWHNLTDVSDFHTAPTMQGLRTNVAVALGYLTAWLGGNGQVVIQAAVNDASAAEISWAQTRHWLATGAVLAEGLPITGELVERLITQELEETTMQGVDAAAAILGETMHQPPDQPLLAHAYRTRMR
ncbi:MAG TPA: malate synthase A [Beutenbergiaceae bacterium]|nr:malate synthase A [Beutenbergiaceae bacterium]